MRVTKKTLPVISSFAIYQSFFPDYPSLSDYFSFIIALSYLYDISIAIESLILFIPINYFFVSVSYFFIYYFFVSIYYFFVSINYFFVSINYFFVFINYIYISLFILIISLFLLTIFFFLLTISLFLLTISLFLLTISFSSNISLEQLFNIWLSPLPFYYIASPLFLFPRSPFFPPPLLSLAPPGPVTDHYPLTPFPTHQIMAAKKAAISSHGFVTWDNAHHSL